MRVKRSVRRKAEADAAVAVQPQPTSQQPPSKTEAFLKRARDTLDEAAYHRFGNVLRDFQSGRVLADDLIDHGREIFAQYPDLLKDFLSYAPAPRDARPVFVPVTPAISSRLVTNAAPSVLHRVDMLGSVGQTSASMRHAVRHVYFATVDSTAGRRRLLAREHKRALRASQHEDRLLDSLHAPPEGSLAWHFAHGKQIPVVSPRDCATSAASRSSAVVARARVSAPLLTEERTVYATARAARIGAILNLSPDRKHTVVSTLAKLRTPTLQHARLLMRALSRSTQRPQIKQQLESALLCYLRGEVGPSSLFLRIATLLTPTGGGAPDESVATIRNAVGAFFPGIATAFAVRDAKLESFQHAQRQRVLAERARGLKGTEGTPLFGPSYVRAMRPARLEAFRHADQAYDALSLSTINLTLVSRAPPSRGNTTEWGIVAASAQLELEFLEHLAKVDTLIHQIEGALRDHRQGRVAAPEGAGPPAMAEVFHGRRATSSGRRPRGRRGGGLSPAASPSVSPPAAPMNEGLPELPPLALGGSLAAAAAAEAAASVDRPSSPPQEGEGESAVGGGAQSPTGIERDAVSPSAVSEDPSATKDASASAEGVRKEGDDGGVGGSPIASETTSPPPAGDADRGEGAGARDEAEDVQALLPEGAGGEAAGGGGGEGVAGIGGGGLRPDVPPSDAGSHDSDLDEATAPGPEPGEDSPFDANVPRSAFCTLLRDADELRRMKVTLQKARVELISLGPQNLTEFLMTWSEQEPDVFPPPSMIVEDYA